MHQKHLFIMDPLEKLNLAIDTSLRIALSLSRFKQDVFFCEIHDLYWESSRDSPSCKARPLNFGESAAKVSLGEQESFTLNTFSSIHMRKDPPFDIMYITATWFLEHCPRTLIVNNPTALRGFNEKMGTLHFPEFCKKSLVSSDPLEILKYIEVSCKGDAVLKPLHLYGGKGITHVNLAKISKEDFLQSLGSAKEHRLVQAFDPRVYDGELRVCTIGSKMLSCCLKVPKKGEFLANTGFGATLHPYKPSSTMIHKVEKLGQALLKQGIYFVGLDLIGEEVSEINITSPRLLIPPGDSRDYYSEIAEWVLGASKRKTAIY